jgi:N-acetylglucosamine kinase-like BadF-type ATPase
MVSAMFDFVPDVFNPEQILLMKAAFEAAWQFVQADSALDAVSMPERHAALAQAVMALAAKGETGALRIANEAIAQVRKVYARAPRAGRTPTNTP